MLHDSSGDRNEYFRPAPGEKTVILELSPDVESRLHQLAVQQRVTNSFVIETALKQLFRNLADGALRAPLREL